MAVSPVDAVVPPLVRFGHFLLLQLRVQECHLPLYVSTEQLLLTALHEEGRL